MKVFAEQLVETEVDRICDICGASVLIEVNGYKYEECAELAVAWGYGSKSDGKAYHIDLCENCFNVAFYALEEHRQTMKNG